MRVNSLELGNQYKFSWSRSSENGPQISYNLAYYTGASHGFLSLLYSCLLINKRIGCKNTNNLLLQDGEIKDTTQVMMSRENPLYKTDIFSSRYFPFWDSITHKMAPKMQRRGGMVSSHDWTAHREARLWGFCPHPQPLPIKMVTHTQMWPTNANKFLWGLPRGQVDGFLSSVTGRHGQNAFLNESTTESVVVA